MPANKQTNCEDKHTPGFYYNDTLQRLRFRITYTKQVAYHTGACWRRQRWNRKMKIIRDILQIVIPKNYFIEQNEGYVG